MQVSYRFFPPIIMKHLPIAIYTQKSPAEND